MSHYNTTHLKGEALIIAQLKVEKQEPRIIAIFKHWNIPMTPHEVSKIYNDIYAAYDGKESPTTSIRRAMSDLTDDGVLVKTTFMKREIYGAINHKWRLR